MRFCPLCQNIYDDPEIVFCTSDGIRLLENNRPTVAQPTFIPLFPPSGGNPPPTIQVGQPDIRFPAENVTNTSPAFNVPPQPPRSASNSNKNIVIAILAVVSVMLLGGILIMNRDKIMNSGKNSNENANSSNSNVEREENKSAGGSKINDQDNIADNTKTIEKETNKSTPVQKSNDLAQIIPNNTEQQYNGTSYFPDKNLSLKLSLTRNGQSLTGSAQTPGDLDDLSGTVQNDGSFSLSGYNRNSGRVTGIWRGNISESGQISGVWTSTNGGSKVRFAARRAR